MTYHVTHYAQVHPRILKYQTGGEKKKNVVIYASVVTLDSEGRRLVEAGELLCAITSGAGTGKYGPYNSGASDGRQTLTYDKVVITETGHEVTLGDTPSEGLFADCVFDVSQCTLHGADLATLKTAMPQASFSD